VDAVPVKHDSLGWLLAPDRLVIAVGLLGWALAYGVLRPLARREDGWQLPPSLGGFATLGALGIVASVPLIAPVQPIAVGAGAQAAAPAVLLPEPVTIVALLAVGGLIAAASRHVATRVALGVLLALAFLGLFWLGL